MQGPLVPENPWFRALLRSKEYGGAPTVAEVPETALVPAPLINKIDRGVDVRIRRFADQVADRWNSLARAGTLVQTGLGEFAQAMIRSRLVGGDHISHWRTAKSSLGSVTA